jgi:hypothetical protein
MRRVLPVAISRTSTRATEAARSWAVAVAVGAAVCASPALAEDVYFVIDRPDSLTLGNVRGGPLPRGASHYRTGATAPASSAASMPPAPVFTRSDPTPAPPPGPQADAPRVHMDRHEAED